MINEDDTNALKAVVDKLTRETKKSQKTEPRHITNRPCKRHKKAHRANEV